jgi:hypothetical protein
MKADKGTRTREVNPVADMMNWNEAIRKEVKHSKIYDNFNVHPTSSKNNSSRFQNVFNIDQSRF